MSGGGSIAAMVSSLRNNRLLLRKSMKERSREAFSNLGEIKSKPKKQYHKQASHQEMKAIKGKIDQENKIENKKRWGLIIFFTIIGISMFIVLFQLMGV
ncbi:MAG: hypothetical protein GQ527_13240 [Bacteroidales bacterium]|nr:hypothetical protein [Bacteroidales bacterium]